MRSLLLVVAACGSSHHGLPDAPPGSDGGAVDGALVDGALVDTALIDAAAIDGVAIDAMTDGAALDAFVMPDAASGVITGGPCLSGAAGATGYRIRWAGTGPGSTAYPVYEVNGFPDKSRDHAGAYGYQIGFTPTWDDPFLGEGGLVLDDSDFIDLELTTAGVPTIAKATLAIYGRSFNTTASGSFNWQTFVGTGATPTNFVANSAPYQWYRADMTAALEANDSKVLLRIKAGPSSDALIVDRVELCIQQ